MSGNRITTFKDLANNSNSAKDTKRNDNKYNGGQASGIETMEPNEAIQRIREMVKKLNSNHEDSDEDSEEDSEEDNKVKPTFSGIGHLLGKEGENPKIIITCWSDGFTVDVEGYKIKFRKYDDPKGIEFMSQIDNSLIPRKLVEKLNIKTSKINMGLIQKRDLFFNKKNETINQIKIKMRFFDGEEIVKYFGESSILADLDQFMKSHKIYPAGKKYEMIINYPRQVLNDFSIPLLKLQNDVIIQKVII